MDDAEQDTLGFFGAIIFFITLIAILLVTVPLTGVLVRFRANYNPKSLHLDAEGGAQAHAGPVVNSYFGMMARVYRLEGIAGFYKGFMPTVSSLVLVSIALLLFTNSTPQHGTYRAPSISMIGTLIYALAMMVLNLPRVVLTSRAITTPQRLSWFGLRHSLRVLLTPTEQRKPWIIYLTPGLMSAQVCHIVYVVIILGVARRLLLPESLVKVPRDDFPTFRFALFLIMSFSSTIVLTPLEVISTRLAIQRNHSSAQFNSVSQEENGDSEGLEYSGDGEDVIGLRSEEDPYHGMLDCAKSIVDEEGTRALFRGWWVTMLAGGASL
jgi:hypothetical protein